MQFSFEDKRVSVFTRENIGLVHTIRLGIEYRSLKTTVVLAYVLGMRRYGHHTIRYVSIRRETIWLFSIRYDTDNNCKNTNIHNIHILLFMNTTEECFDWSVLQTHWQDSQRI